MNNRIKKIVANKDFLENWLSDAIYHSPWFNVTDYNIPSNGATKGECREEKWSDALLNGGYIVVCDWEEEKEYKITLKEIIKGFQKFIFNNPKEYANIMEGDGDWTDADALLQTVIFGEVTYA